jgi:hypothetical protein
MPGVDPARRSENAATPSLHHAKRPFHLKGAPLTFINCCGYFLFLFFRVLLYPVLEFIRRIYSLYVYAG